MGKVTKADLISQVAEQADISKAAAAKAIDAFTSSVSDALTKGDSVSLVGFGTFSVSQRAARDGRNPQTGETMKIPASTVAKFKPGKTLKDSVNG